MREADLLRELQNIKEEFVRINVQNRHFLKQTAVQKIRIPDHSFILKTNQRNPQHKRNYKDSRPLPFVLAFRKKGHKKPPDPYTFSCICRFGG